MGHHLGAFPSGLRCREAGQRPSKPVLLGEGQFLIKAGGGEKCGQQVRAGPQVLRFGREGKLSLSEQ